MSAGAILISDTEAHFASDGILCKLDDNGDLQPQRWDANKIRILNDHCGILWLGAGIVRIWPEVEQQLDANAEPWQCAHIISETLKRWYSKNDIDLSARVMIAGLQADKPAMYEVTSHNDFEIKKHEVPSGGVYCWSMIFGSNHDNPFPDLVGKLMQTTDDLQQVCKRAFLETLKQYKSDQVGGNMYFRSLSDDPFIGHDLAEFGENTDGLSFGADDKSGTNARFYARADGKIFHDAIGQDLTQFESRANFGRNPADASTTFSNWSSFTSATIPFGQSSVASDNEVLFKAFQVRKRFGIESIRILARVRRATASNTGGSAAHEAKIIAETNFGGVSDEVTFFNSSFATVVLELDMSGVADGTIGMVELKLFARADITFGGSDGDTVETEAFCSENLLILTSTEEVS
jgi:hypothetical protein